MGCLGFYAKFKRFFMRFLVYYIVLLWPYVKLGNMEGNTDDYKKKLQMIFYLLNLKGNTARDIIQDPSLILFVYSILEIFFGILGTFGFFCANIISVILFIVTNLIYFNPYFPENSISLFETREEVFLNIGILVSLLMITFYPYEMEDDNIVEKEITVEDIIKENEEKKKINAEMPKRKKN